MWKILYFNTAIRRYSADEISGYSCCSATDETIAKQTKEGQRGHIQPVMTPHDDCEPLALERGGNRW